MMEKHFSLLVLASLLMGAFGQMPAQADPPPWAPAHGYRAKQYSYVYYPQRQIYYSPASGIWFWLRSGNWQFGASLPVEYRSSLGGGVPIILETDRPYLQHSSVLEQYGKVKKNKHK
uniref:Uncharacterized protein n=1 Tax=Cyanothece sp. (strain PCC 7425 / ATCC 29141) TaxID=395961 RepID=B8HS34_CYAP4